MIQFWWRHPRRLRLIGRKKAESGRSVVAPISGGSGRRYERGRCEPFSLRPVNPGRIFMNAQGGAFVRHDDQ